MIFDKYKDIFTKSQVTYHIFAKTKTILKMKIIFIKLIFNH
ncbi:hypothetical protein P9202_1277 [Prochlorococcus marinus str. MIT 9202]|nr:hypothetical protein P9202_1277 [Prochlorococcus marinus str. MIT 9202]